MGIDVPDVSCPSEGRRELMHPIRILHLEDSAVDADLIAERLRLGGIAHETRRVLARAEFAQALEEGGFDLILSDFSLPSFDGMSALEMAQAACPATPFVFISGVLGEDVAVESLKRGATDFVVKQRLERLPATVLRALDDARRRAEHQRTLEALQSSEERLRLALSAAQAGNWDWDVPTDRFVWSAEYARLCGLPPEHEPPGLACWLQSVHPDDRGPLRRCIEQALAGGQADFRMEYRVIVPDRGTRWLLALGRTSYAADGRPLRTTGMSIDITERKEAEERQLLLAREVDHRARNLLAVVQAMLSLTQADSIDSFVAAVKGRVAALSRAHALLSSSRWAGVNLAKLAGEELRAFADASRATIEGPPVTLHPEATQAATVVLHELATNAAKYGALSVPDGRVELGWRFQDGDVLLHWAERGGPPPKPPTRRGFGSQIMIASARQLGGELQLDWRAEGLRAELRIAGINVMNTARSPDGRSIALAAGAAVPPGARILVVEDNGFVSLEVERLLEQLGCVILGPAPTLARAMELAQSAESLDAAILDVNLGGGADSFPVARALKDRGVPFLFCTGYDRPVVDGTDHDGAEVIAKPIQLDQLAGALGRLLSTPCR